MSAGYFFLQHSVRLPKAACCQPVRLTLYEWNPLQGGGSHQCFKDSKAELNAVIIEDITVELWFIDQVVLPPVFSAAPI